jgi:hypothetical protein
MTRTQKRKEKNLGFDGLSWVFKCFFNDEIVLGHPLNFKRLLFGISHEFTVVSQDSRQDLLSVPCVASVILGLVNTEDHGLTRSQKDDPAIPPSLFNHVMSKIKNRFWCEG